MPPNQPLTDPSGFLRKHWSRLAQAAVWITSVVGVFLIRPPGLVIDDDRKIVPFAGFIVAALLGLASVLLYRWGRRLHAWRWWSAGALLFTLSVAGFFTYDYYIGHWTAPYAANRIIIGTHWTSIGNKAQVEGNYPSVEEMLKDFGGQADILWDKKELEKRRRVLAVIYVSCVAVSALTIITIVQAIHCLAKK